MFEMKLDHGARPDIKDANHRSSVQYSLRHPRTLWLCERAMREQRTKAFEVTQPPRI